MDRNQVARPIILGLFGAVVLGITLLGINHLANARGGRIANVAKTVIAKAYVCGQASMRPDIGAAAVATKECERAREYAEAWLIGR